MIFLVVSLSWGDETEQSLMLSEIKLDRTQNYWHDTDFAFLVFTLKSLNPVRIFNICLSNTGIEYFFFLFNKLLGEIIPHLSLLVSANNRARSPNFENTWSG